MNTLFVFLMSFSSKIYWFTRLDGIKNTLTLLSILTIMTAIVFFAVWACNTEGFDRNLKEKGKGSKRKFFLSLWVFLIFCLGNSFVPSSSDAFIIMGIGESVEYLKSNKDAVQIPDKALKVLNQYLDEKLKDNKSSEFEDESKGVSHPVKRQ